MFGPDLLVAPITAAGLREREVYLPSGSEWTDPWTKEIYTGGTTIKAKALIERIPVFIRDGAALPIVG